MKWEEFLNDPELNSSAEFHSPPDGDYLFGKVLHDVLECLNAYKGWFDEVVSRGKVELPSDTLNKLTKQLPLIEDWVSKLNLLWTHTGKYPSTSPEWPNLIAQIGQVVAEAPLLEKEIATLVIPSSELPKLIVQSITAIVARLNLILQDIQDQEYKRLWTTIRYGDLLNSKNENR